MKKAHWILLGVLLLLTGGFLGWYSFWRTPFYRAEEILPSHTIAFLDVPDSGGSRERFGDTATGRIAAEAEVKAFLEEVRSAIGRQAETRAPATALAAEFLQIVSASQGEVFLALTDISIVPTLDGALLLGFDPGKQRRKTERALSEFLEKCRAQHPSLAVAEVEYESVSYKLLTFSPTLKLAFVRLGNLFLLSKGEDAIRQAISRAKGTVEDRLRDSAPFTTYRGKCAGADIIFFLNPQAAISRFRALGLLQSLAKGFGAEMSFRSFLETCAFKGLAIESHAWQIPVPGSQPTPASPEPKACAFATLKAASSDTILYAAGNVDASGWVTGLAPDLDQGAARWLQVGLQWLGQALEAAGVHWRQDFLPHLGPEMGFIVEWTERDLYPSATLMIESKNPPAVQEALNKLIQWAGTQQPAAGGGFQSSPGPLGTTIFSMQMGDEEDLAPSLAMYEGFLILSINRESLDGLLRTMAGSREKLSSNKSFQDLRSRFGTEHVHMVYCDQRRVFERSYSLVGAALSLVRMFLPESEDFFDMRKLPRTQTISQHLSPSIWVGEPTAEGYHHASTGPVSAELFVTGTAFWLAGEGLRRQQTADKARPPMHR